MSQDPHYGRHEIQALILGSKCLSPFYNLTDLWNLVTFGRETASLLTLLLLLSSPILWSIRAINILHTEWINNFKHYVV